MNGMQTVLFVCRGNTCRSAMAEGIAKTLLDPSKYTILSAGLDAYDGMPSTPEAIRALSAMGIDIRQHRAKRLTAEMMRVADVIYPMTTERERGTLRRFPQCADKTKKLDPDDVDIVDPIGGGFDEYLETARQLRSAICRRFGLG